MKKIVAILAMFFCGSVWADDFEKSQHNFRLRSGNYGLELREEINSNKDHVQLSYFGIKNTEVRFRYVDNLGAKEYRPQISYMVYENKHFFFRPRLDYRHFLGDSPDYFSFRTSFGTFHPINNEYRVWTEVNPIWDFGQSKANDASLDKAQFRLGVDYLTPGLRIGPFIQYETNGQFSHTDTFIGTNLFLTY